MNLKAKNSTKHDPNGSSVRRGVERRKGVFRASAGIVEVVDQRLKTLRSSERFRLWLRVVLPPDEHRRFERWALDNEEGFVEFVRRFSEVSSEKTGKDQGFESLVDDIYETLLKIEDLSFDYSFDDWDSSQREAQKK